jgi:hypothetical protein
MSARPSEADIPNPTSHEPRFAHRFNPLPLEISAEVASNLRHGGGGKADARYGVTMLGSNWSN